MTLNEAVVASIRRYPEIYPNRTEVIHQYLCVSGNAMEWTQGVLAKGYRHAEEESNDEGRSQIERTVEASLKRLSDGGFHETVTEIRKENLVRKNEMDKRVADAENLATVTSDNVRIYPLSEYSLIASVPDDVQPDWLAAVREMIFVVFQSPNAIVPFHASPERHEATRLANVEFAEQVLVSLAERFGRVEGQPASYAEWLETHHNAPPSP